MADVAKYLDIKVLKKVDDIHSRYPRHRLLGSGFFGDTYEVRDRRDPRRRRYAMKVQEKKSGDDRNPMILLKEVLILSRILPGHPNIIEIKEVLSDPTQLYIVTELCQKDMAAFCPVADNTSGRRAFLQLVEAVQTLHSYGVMHADIKPDNVLFKDTDFMQLKLIDFGVSKYKPEWATQRYDGFDPTRYMIHEELAIDRNLPDSFKWNDIVPLGKILYHIISGHAEPIISEDPVRAMQTEYRPRTEIFDAAAMDLLCRIGPEPFGPELEEQLLTLDQIRAHPWLNWQQPPAPALLQLQPREPDMNQLNQCLAELRQNLTVLRRLLNQWMVVRLRPVTSVASINHYYKVVGSVPREPERNEDSRDLDVVDSLTQTKRMEMRLIFGNMSVKPQLHPPGTKDPLLVYVELLITLRILPTHQRFANIKSVYVNENFVAMVRERMEGPTMVHFFVRYANNSSSRRVFKQLVEAVRFMHLHGVLHMDLHPQHIVWKTASPYSAWKIVNFDKARFVPEMALLRHERFEPDGYLPRELQHQPAAGANIQVDITALGRILHAMMAGRWERNPAKCGNHFPRRDLFDQEAGDLLSRIGPEPFGPPARNRIISMEDIYFHPWLQARE